ncbi:MAG: hypothetical protein ACKORL_13320, partial [Phycisphaerales bacterium]
MPFRDGSISYSRFGVSGSLPDDANEGALALLGRHVVKQRALADEGTLSGWCSGRHVFDADFSWEHCGFSGAILCAMRVDRAKVPPEIRRAYVAMAEDERRATEADAKAGARSGDGAAAPLSRAARREARADADRRCKEEVADGRYRRIGMVPVLFDLVHRSVLTPASGDAVFKELKALVEATYGCRLERRSAGGVAADILGARGMTSDLDDAVPEAFT